MIKEGGNTKLALEVNFYAGSRELYDAEVEKDAGGLYALVDGLGLYRGLQPVAGPCPIDVNCTTTNVESFDNYQKSTGTFTSSEVFVDLVDFFKKYVGHGGRPLRVIGLDGQTLLMYNCGEVSDNALSFVQATLATDIPESNLVEYVSVTLHKLILIQDGTFTYTKISDNLPLTNISVRNLHERLLTAESYVDKLQEETADLYDQVDRIDSELDVIRKNISTIESGIAAIEKNIDEVESNVSKNAQSIAANAQSIVNINALIEQIVADVAKNTSSISDNASEIVEVKQRLDTAEGNISDNTDAIAQNAGDIAQAQKDIQSHTQQISDLSTKQSGTDAKVAENTQGVADNKASIESVSDDLAKLTEVVNTLDASSGGMGTEVAELKTKVADLTTRVETLENTPCAISWTTLP